MSTLLSRALADAEASAALQTCVEAARDPNAAIPAQAPTIDWSRSNLAEITPELTVDLSTRANGGWDSTAPYGHEAESAEWVFANVQGIALGDPAQAGAKSVRI